MGTGELTGDDWDGYAARWSAMHGGFDPRQSLPVVRLWMFFTYLCGRPLARWSVSANTLTTFGVLLCLATPTVLLVAPRWWAVVAGALVLVTVMVESLDGAVAVIVGRITSLNRIYDAIARRLGEACWLAALALAGAPGWLAGGACAMAWLHEYTRSQAMMAGVGPTRMVTMGDRPMRVWAASVGLILAGLTTWVSPDLATGVATMAVTVWLMLGLGGLVQLIEAIYHALR